MDDAYPQPQCRSVISFDERHQPPQRRLRPRSAAAVRRDQLTQDQYFERRVRLRHAAASHARGTRSGRKMAIDECLGPPSHRFRIEPAAPARQTLRRSLVYGYRLQPACFARRQPAQCSLCRVARQHSGNFSRRLLEFYPMNCDKIWCYVKLLPYVQSTVPVSRLSSLYWGRERAGTGPLEHVCMELMSPSKKGKSHQISKIQERKRSSWAWRSCFHAML